MNERILHIDELNDLLERVGMLDDGADLRDAIAWAEGGAMDAAELARWRERFADDAHIGSTLAAFVEVYRERWKRGDSSP